MAAMAPSHRQSDAFVSAAFGSEAVSKVDDSVLDTMTRPLGLDEHSASMRIDCKQVISSDHLSGRAARIPISIDTTNLDSGEMTGGSLWGKEQRPQSLRLPSDSSSRLSTIQVVEGSGRDCAVEALQRSEQEFWKMR